MNRFARAAGWFAGLAAALVVLRLAGTGELATPPLASLDALSTWVDERQPITVAAALVRLVAELALWYVIGLSVLHAVAAASRLPGARSVADALAVPGVSRLVRAGLGIGLVAVTAASSEPAAAPGAPTMQRLPATPAPVVQERIGAGTATMRPVRDDEPGTAWMTPVPDVIAPSHPDGPTDAPPSPATWRVEAGDSFWSIAEELLTEAWQRPPSDAEIDPLWRVLVETNRDRLVTDDPDLIQPGQVFEIPPVPPAPPPG